MKRTLAVIILLSAVGSPIAAEPARRALIRPTLVRLQPGQMQKFKATLLPTPLGDAVKAEDVTWSVNGIPGGNRKLGTIDGDGIYTAPPKAPTPCEINIRAEVPGASNRYLFATVLMGQPSYKVVTNFTDSSLLRDPHGIALDADGNIVVTDEENSQVVRFTPKGKFIDHIGSGKGAEPGYFTDARVACTDAAGNIWVSDVKEHGFCIQAFASDGKFIRAFGKNGTGHGELLRAHGMQFDSKGRLYVADVDNSKVNIYEPDGKFVASWGKTGLLPGQFNAPHGLVIDPSDDVFISNFYGPMQKFDPDGNFLFEFAHGDPFDGPVHFHSAAGDRWGNIYLIVRIQGYDAPADEKVKMVKYNNNGDFITAWRFAQTGDRGNCAAVDNEGNVYCVFKQGRRVGVQVFAPQ
jgi:DNA-binding beta-propeller fold protein YncE